MLSVHGRRPAAVVIEPIARRLVSWGVTPNVVTIASTTVAVVLSVALIPTGWHFLAAVLLGVAVASDMIDGTMARMRGGGTRFGATLDASCDRITDGVLFGSIAWWMAFQDDHEPYKGLFACALVIMVVINKKIKAVLRDTFVNLIIDYIAHNGDFNLRHYSRYQHVFLQKLV